MDDDELQALFAAASEFGISAFAMALVSSELVTRILATLIDRKLLTHAEIDELFLMTLRSC